MSNIIQEVYEGEFYLKKGEISSEQDKDSCSYEGFILKTEKGSLIIAISDEGLCCETWGHVTSLDDLQSLVGQSIVKVQTVDEDFDKKDIVPVFSEDEPETACFVNVITDKQEVQFAVYNSHNGYYGHAVSIFYLGEELVFKSI